MLPVYAVYQSEVSLLNTSSGSCGAVGLALWLTGQYFSLAVVIYVNLTR